MELAEQMGDWYIASVAAWLAAEVEDALGNYDAAIGLRRRELEWLTRIGGNPHNEARARAHLAHLARLTGDGAIRCGRGRSGSEARRQGLGPRLRRPDRGGPEGRTVVGCRRDLTAAADTAGSHDTAEQLRNSVQS